MEPLLLRCRVLRLIAVALFVGAVYGPLAGALAGALDDPATSLMHVVSWRRGVLLGHSLAFSLALAVAVAAIGTLAALTILRRRPNSAEALQWLLLASVALPPTVPALAWGYAFTLFSRLTGVGAAGNWLLAGVAQGMAMLPFATGIAFVALRTADPVLLDAARVAAAPARLLFGVALPLARPTLLAGAAFVFLLSLLDYTIPSVFGVNVYALEVFVAFSSTQRVADALWLSLPLMGCVVLMMTAVSGLPRRLAQTAGDAAGRYGGTLPAGLEGLLGTAALLVVAALTVPLLAMVPALGDPAYLGRTMAASWPEARYTLLTSVAATLVALTLAVGPAVELARGGRPARIGWIVCLLPFLTPPALTGIGLVALWSPIRALDVYGTPLMTVAAEVARFTPVAVAILSAWLLRADATLIEAALVTGSSWRRVLSGVVLPLAAPGLAAAAGIAFALSLGEIGATLLVTPAGEATLTMKAYNYLHYGGSEAAAGLCLLLMGLAAAGVALPVLALRSGRPTA